MHPHSTLRIAKVFCAALCLGLASASSWAAIVWDLNPNDLNAPVGSSSRVYTSQGVSITAYGFDNNNGIGTAHDLFYKFQQDIDGAVEFGLGLTNVKSNELQAGLHFIQFDVSQMLAAGLLNGQISVGSIQAGESFAIYGSNVLGTLGTQLGGTYGTAFDNQSVALPNFGQFSFYSIVAAADDVLPVSLSADANPIPEVGTVLPIVALLLIVLSTHAWRRRSAQAA
jgi:hypothetical protein